MNLYLSGEYCEEDMIIKFMKTLKQLDSTIKCTRRTWNHKEKDESKYYSDMLNAITTADINIFFIDNARNTYSNYCFEIAYAMAFSKPVWIYNNTDEGLTFYNLDYSCLFSDVTRFSSLELMVGTIIKKNMKLRKKTIQRNV